MKKRVLINVLIVVVLFVKVMIVSYCFGAEQQSIKNGQPGQADPTAAKLPQEASVTSDTDKTTKLHVKRTGTKYSVTPEELNRAKRVIVNLPVVEIPWQHRLKEANDSFTSHYTTVKQRVDSALQNGEAALANCSVENYTAQDLQKQCKDNESVQVCLKRLVKECKGVQNAFSGWSPLELKAGLKQLKQDIDLIDEIIFKDWDK